MKRIAAIIGIAASAALAPVGMARAGDPAPFPDFTFKRVAAPKPGGGPRITVQIGPEADTPAPRPQAEAAEPATPAAQAYPAFWQAVSPSLDAAGPGRLARALAALDGVPVPRLQPIQDIASRHGTEILKATIGTRVSPALVLAVIGIESSGRPDAVSSAGAAGLMQLMPDTATRFGVTDRSDPAQNIMGGVAYLDWLLERFGNDPVLALAGYNAGENAVKDYAGVPPYAETRAYVPKVLAAWTVARGLCLTPPELITDGCALRLSGARDG